MQMRLLALGWHPWNNAVDPMMLGSRLPTLPLWLESDQAVSLDLERSYEAMFVEMRVPV